MLFPVGSMPNAPQLVTRKALLVIDMQNDFLQEDGKLFVENARQFLPYLPTLVTKFREKGEVFWAHTEFRMTCPTICPELGSHLVLLEDFLDTAKNSEAGPPCQPDHLKYKSNHTSQEGWNDNPEAFLAERSSADSPRCCLPDTFGCAPPKTIASLVDRERDSTIVKSNYSAFQTNSLLPTLRMKLITQLYLCGSLSNISVYATALHAVSHGLEVTIIEDCVGYRSAKCHQEAMRQMADAMGVNGTDYQELMDDLNGNLGEVVTASTFKSDVGTRQMKEGDTSAEDYTMRLKVKRWIDNTEPGKRAVGDLCIQQEIDCFEAASSKRRSVSDRAAPTTRHTKNHGQGHVVAPQKRTSDKIEDDGPTETVPHSSPNAKTNRVRMRRSHIPSEAARVRSASSATLNETTFDKLHCQQDSSGPLLGAIEADSDPDRPLSDDMSSLVDKAKSVGRTLRGGKRSKKRARETLGPDDFIGERDSRVIYDFLPAADHFNDAFARLRAQGESCEVCWQTMYHRSGKVPRLVAVQGEVMSDGSIPIYRHPADESPPLLPFSPTAQSIREEVEKAVDHPVNHVLIQLYRGGEDNISEHSDKTLDIVRGSFIVNVSLGAMRTMVLRAKKSASAAQGSGHQPQVPILASSPPSNAEVGRTTQRIPLPHNSLFVLGQDTNQMWLHAIRADKRPLSEKTAEELAFGGERISLTFRHVGTFINPKEGTIWGQGATSKRAEDARPIMGGSEADKEGERLIRAFGQENHQSLDFDWQAQYGAGFDVVNFNTKGNVGVTT